MKFGLTVSFLLSKSVRVSSISFCRTAFLYCVTSVLYAPNAFAGAWTQPTHAHYVEFSLSRYDTRQEFNADAMQAPILSLSPPLHDGRYVSTNLGMYAEYGVTHEVTLVGSVQAKISSSTYWDSANHVSVPFAGLGDLSLYGRYALTTAPIVSAVQFGWKFLTSELQGSIAAGGSLPVPHWNTYVNTEWGYRIRTGAVSNEIFYLEECGFAIFNGAAGLQLAIDGTITQGSARTVLFTEISRNQTFRRATAGLSLAASEKLRLVLKFARILFGRNTLAGSTYSIGIAL